MADEYVVSVGVKADFSDLKAKQAEATAAVKKPRRRGKRHIRHSARRPPREALKRSPRSRNTARLSMLLWLGRRL